MKHGRRGRRARGLFFVLLAFGCAPKSTGSSAAPNDADQRMSCGWVQAPSGAFVRSEAELSAWFSDARRHAENSGPRDERCEPSRLGEIDWSTQVVAFVSQSGSSNIKGMAIRGDALVVRRHGVAQCGGQELPNWMGLVLVAVPSEVVEIKTKFKRAPACKGPPRP